MTQARLVHIVIVALGCALVACAMSRADRPRCTQCGMFIRPSDHWQAGVTTNDQRALDFDGPKCLLRWLAAHGSEARDDAWVTEYYTQSRRRAADCFFVAGSDVRGPMGEELVPLTDRQSAARFSREHHGRQTLEWRELRALRDLGAIVR